MHERRGLGSARLRRRLSRMLDLRRVQTLQPHMHTADHDRIAVDRLGSIGQRLERTRDAQRREQNENQETRAVHLVHVRFLSRLLPINLGGSLWMCVLAP